MHTESDERNPFISSDGTMYFSSDETGIFNIYKYDFNTGESIRLTNVTGGAFMPGVGKNGDIVYAGYTSGGYKIFTIDQEEQQKEPKAEKHLQTSL